MKEDLELSNPRVHAPSAPCMEKFTEIYGNPRARVASASCKNKTNLFYNNTVSSMNLESKLVYY